MGNEQWGGFAFRKCTCPLATCEKLNRGASLPSLVFIKCVKAKRLINGNAVKQIDHAGSDCPAARSQETADWCTHCHIRALISLYQPQYNRCYWGDLSTLCKQGVIAENSKIRSSGESSSSPRPCWWRQLYRSSLPRLNPRNGCHPEAGSNKWRVFVWIPFWSAQQETCVTWRPANQPPPPPPTFQQEGGRWGKERRGYVVVEGSAGGEREEGREGPPSLGSQPLNQALSHPVNLKQSWFNSSCLSALGPKAGARLGSSQGRSAGRGPTLEEKQSGQARRCSRGHIAHKHPFISSLPSPASHSFPLQFLHFSAVALFTTVVLNPFLPWSTPYICSPPNNSTNSHTLATKWFIWNVEVMTTDQVRTYLRAGHASKLILLPLVHLVHLDIRLSIAAEQKHTFRSTEWIVFHLFPIKMLYSFLCDQWTQHKQEITGQIIPLDE